MMKLALLFSIAVHVVLIYTLSLLYQPAVALPDISVRIVAPPFIDQQTMLDQQQFDMDEEPVVVLCPIEEQTDE